MSNKEEAKLKAPCPLCLRGPSIGKCRYGGHCKENNYDFFIELWHQEVAEDRIDVIGQNGNDGLHYDATQTDGLQALSSKPIQRLAADDSKVELKRSQEKQAKAKVAVSDGSTASYYQLPAGATELQQLISHRDMNAQLGEIFRAAYRYGQCPHSDKAREMRKVIFYAEAELDRLAKYEIQATTTEMKESKYGLGEFCSAKIPVAYSLKEGGTWIKWTSLIAMIAITNIPEMKGYAAIKFSDGSIYDFILNDWR